MYRCPKSNRHFFKTYLQEFDVHFYEKEMIRQMTSVLLWIVLSVLIMFHVWLEWFIYWILLFVKVLGLSEEFEKVMGEWHRFPSQSIRDGESFWTKLALTSISCIIACLSVLELPATWIIESYQIQLCDLVFLQVKGTVGTISVGQNIKWNIQKLHKVCKVIRRTWRKKEIRNIYGMMISYMKCK